MKLVQEKLRVGISAVTADGSREKTPIPLTFMSRDPGSRRLPWLHRCKEDIYREYDPSSYTSAMDRYDHGMCHVHITPTARMRAFEVGL